MVVYLKDLILEKDRFRTIEKYFSIRAIFK